VAAGRRVATPDFGDQGVAVDLGHCDPDRPLTAEIAAILDTGYVRGAGLWHLAVALFVDPGREIDFVSLDAREVEISRRIGFSQQ
jgi:hypothetical protein